MSEHAPLTRAVEDSQKAAALAVIDAAFRTASDELQSKVAAGVELIRRFAVLTEKHQAIAAKAQRYQAWR